MFKNLIEKLIGPEILRRAIRTVLTALTGAIIAYLVDIGLLDGAGADALASSGLAFLETLLDVIL